MSAVTNGYQAQQRFAVRAGYTFNSQFDIAATYTNLQYIPGIISSLHSEAIWNTGGVVLGSRRLPGTRRAAIVHGFSCRLKFAVQEGAATAALLHLKFGDRSLQMVSAAYRPILDGCRPTRIVSRESRSGSHNALDRMILRTDFYIHEPEP